MIHFYHLHALDWVDVVSALKANPAATAALAQKVSPLLAAVVDRVISAMSNRTVKKFVESGQLGIFQNAYWGHPAYKLPPEANLMAVAHYLEALKWQKEIIKIHTIFGGKNPHPNYLVGGMAAPSTCRATTPSTWSGSILVGGPDQRRRMTIVEQLYIPDLLAIASFYPEWTTIGGGLGNYMTYGDVPQNGIGDISKFRIPRGIILNKNLAEVLPLDHTDPNQIQEADRALLVHLPGRRKRPASLGRRHRAEVHRPEAALQELDEDARYSWVKAPRWKGIRMEVGPLARMLVGYASGQH